MSSEAAQELTPRKCADTLPWRGAVAQLGERLNGIQEVVGSIPISSTVSRFAGTLQTYSDDWQTFRPIPGGLQSCWSVCVAHEGNEHEAALRLHFASLLDVAEDGIVTLNEAQQIVLFNRGAERIFGYSRREAIGQPLDALIPLRFRPQHGEHVKNFARSEIDARWMGERSEVYGRRKDGSEFPADVSISKLTVKGQVYLTAIVRDVTERKRAQEAILKLNQELEQRVVERTAELLESTRQLQRKNEENETFVYSVSHDLRSPLVNLEGFSQELRVVAAELRKLLAGREIPAEIRDRAGELIDHAMTEALGYIEAGVERLGRIIDALLRLSRAGRVEYHLQWVDVSKLVQRIFDSLHATIASQHAKVSLARNLPLAWGDPIAIEQVFGNLIANALKYIDPKRPGQIEVGCCNVDGQDTYFVCDNGRGIPEEYLPQLFRAFRRLHPDVAGGEGMGLAIVRRVVERHGGRVWAESVIGRGTKFFVTFPVPPAGTYGEEAEQRHES
jgi:PAS domain S-box-containing protein